MCEFVYMIEEQQPLAISQQHKKNIFIAKIHSITNCVVCECRTSSCCRHRFDYPDKKIQTEIYIMSQMHAFKNESENIGTISKKGSKRENEWYLCVSTILRTYNFCRLNGILTMFRTTHRGEGIDTSPQNSLLLLKSCKIFSITRLCWIIQVHRIPLVNQVYVKGDCCSLFCFNSISESIFTFSSAHTPRFSLSIFQSHIPYIV